MTADIITIGNEILIGQIVDTNSAWLATHLNELGIRVHRMISIGDTAEEITSALNESSNHSQLIIITGGLGPTNDDITKKTLAQYFGMKLVHDNSVLKDVESFVFSRNGQMNDLNWKQAEVPDGCKVLHNPCGTAPGMWFEKNGVIFISLPGVPHEMKEIFEKEIGILLEGRSDNAITHKTIILQGIAESALAERIQDWENKLPQDIQLAYLPSPGIVKLRLSIYNKKKNEAEAIIQSQIPALEHLVGKLIVCQADKKLEEVIGEILKKNGKTISTAESCTGGGLASMIVSVPGSSVYFKGSVVAYSNEIKASILKVDEKLISDHGAVSREVVEAMALNCRVLFQTDYSIAISGIAGPDGGTAEKPVGTVWIAVARNNQVTSKKFLLGRERNLNIQKACITAMNMLRTEMIS